MGIREHLSKEVDEKEMKLSDLEMDVDKKKEEPFFDAERDISETEFQEMNNSLDVYRRKMGEYEFSDLAAGLKVLFPHRIEEFDIREDDWGYLEPELKDIDHGISPFSDYAVNVKILFPDEVKNCDLNLYFEQMKADLKERAKRKVGGEIVFMELIEIMFKLKFLFDYEDDEIKLDDKAWQIIKKDLANYRKEEWGAAEKLAKIKLLFPEHSREVGYNKDIQIELMRRLNGLASISAFAQEAMWLKILAANDVRIADQGFEFVDSEKVFKQEKKTRPERKTF